MIVSRYGEVHPECGPTISNIAGSQNLDLVWCQMPVAWKGPHIETSLPGPMGSGLPSSAKGGVRTN